jgi:hypothetical protein
MVVITFPDNETRKKALGFLFGRFSGKALKSGEILVPEIALPAFADQISPSRSEERQLWKPRQLWSPPNSTP